IEGGDSRKKSLPSFTYSAWEEFADFSITECCKEARHVSCSLLPRSLATVSCEPRIRFDPAITAIYIHNFHSLLMTVDFNKENYTGEDWFCKDSCIGSGITTLVV